MALNTRSKAAVRIGQPGEASWPSRSPVSSFVHILHLLDLDLLHDWPQITANTFSTRTAHQNLQQRIRAAEWSLFRLSEIHDPLVTRDKLQPFFPPQSQLQSQNLRAALLRVLTELKKTGMLRQDVVLRKTTFDECKGDKFEELIFQFAHLTLHTNLKRQKDPVLKLTKHDSERCFTLMLAYQVSLCKTIAVRRRLDRELVSRKNGISERVQRARTQRAQLAKHKPLESSICASVREGLRESWLADLGWIDTLLHASPNSQLPHAVTEPAAYQKTMVDLIDMVDAQETRLRRWRAIWSTFDKSAPQSSSSDPKGGNSGRPVFAEHQSLSGREDAPPHHDAVISDVKVSPHAVATVNMSQHVAYAPEATLGALEADASSFDMHNVLQAQLENSLGRPESQSNPPVSTSPPESYNSSPPETPSRFGSRQLPYGVQSALAPRPEDSRRRTGPTISLQGMDTDEMQFEDIQHVSPDRAFLPKSLGHNDPQPHDVTRERHQGSGMTLEARTRASMAAFFPPEGNMNSSPPKAREADRHDTPNAKVASHDAAGDENLMERTRKSLSLLNLISDAKSTRRPSRGPRLSQLYPINPFETPRKTSLQPIQQTPSSTSTTPREKLFSDEAEYSSVFKSRPKIAQSPMASPDRSMVDDDDSILAQRVPDLEL
jgi:hypothetical protein